MTTIQKINALFDQGMIALLKIIHLDNYYRTNSTFQKFMKYGSWITLEYWFVKGPLTALFTERFGFWYVVSAFFSGLICTVIGFVLSHWWVWRSEV